MNMFRKQFYSLFAIVLLAGIVFVLNKQGGTVYAADTVVLIENGDYQVEEHTDISEYRQAGEFKAPVFADGSGKWIFAGWYTDQACTKALSGSVVSPVKEGSYYAKYVRREVLSVKCQLKEGTRSESADTILRCVSSVDSLKYKNIGLELVIPDGRVKRMQSQNVGTRIQGRTDVNLGEYAYSPKAVDVESEYFFSATERITNADFGKGYVVRPYWVTKDGTCVYGVSKYVTVNEGIQREVVHIPVKMNTIPTENAVFRVTDSLGQEVLAKCVAYDEKGGYAHLEIPKVPTVSVTKYTITDDSAKELGTYIYRNVAAKYDGRNPDTSWYRVYNEEGREGKFVIATSADLYGFATLVNSGENFKNKEVYLVSDIVANTGEAAVWKTGTEVPAHAWTPIGSEVVKAFEGTFDGQGHTISGVYLKTTVKNSGLFGVIGMNAVVKNFSLINSYFETSAMSLGSIAGRCEGTVDTVYSNAIVVSSNQNVGGLIGQVYFEGDGQAVFNRCWFDGTVTKTSKNVKSGVGGVIGTNSSNSKLTNCLFTGMVDASMHSDPESSTNPNISPRAGGIVGYIRQKSIMEISYSFSAGIVKVHETATVAYGQAIGYVIDDSEVKQTCVYVSNACNTVYKGKKTGSSIELALSEVLGANAKKKMPRLFLDDTWITVENGLPVLKSFAQYGKDAGETSFLHRWILTTAAPSVTLSTPQQLSDEGVISTQVFHQGGYTDGHYFYQAVITEKVNPEENNKGVIIKQDLTGKEETLVSQEFALGHGNDITYNEKTGELIVCTMKKDGELAFLDPANLELKRTQKAEVYINNIAYNAKRDCYVVGYEAKAESDGTYRKFGIMDSNFKRIKGPFKPNQDTWPLVGQGVTCDDEYIYMILSESKAISKYPVIAVYDWEGQFVKMIHLTLPSKANELIEAENISVVGNKIYIGVGEWWKSPAARKMMVYSFTR